MTTLREFKVKQFAMLKEIERELTQKYPQRAERIRYIVDVISSKLDHLRRFTLYDYIRTIDLASKEFPEFARMIPDAETIEELLNKK